MSKTKPSAFLQRTGRGAFKLAALTVLFGCCAWPLSTVLRSVNDRFDGFVTTRWLSLAGGDEVADSDIIILAYDPTDDGTSELFHRLAGAQPKVIAFDQDLVSRLEPSTFAEALVAVRRNGGATLLPHPIGHEGANLATLTKQSFSHLEDSSLPTFCLNNMPTTDGFLPWPATAQPLPASTLTVAVGRLGDGVLRYPLLIGWEARHTGSEAELTRTARGFLPTMAFSAALHYWGIDVVALNRSGDWENDRGEPVIEVFWGDRIVLRPMGSLPIEIPVDGQCRAYLKTDRNAQTLDCLSASEVTATTTPPDRLHGALVFMECLSPATGLPAHSVDAAVADSLLSHKVLRPVGGRGLGWLLFGLWLGLAVAAFFRGRLQWILWSMLFTGFLIASYWSLSTRSVIIPSTLPLALLLSAGLAFLVIGFLTDGRMRRQLQGLFKNRVAPEVLAWVERYPDCVPLDGESRVATTLVSNLAGFTAISERLRPEELVELLNAYFTSMTEIIIGYTGYLDNVEGDAVLAAWGVPASQEDHAVLACYAALQQQAHLNEMNPFIKERFDLELTVRIGLDTGKVLAGNVGPEGHASYTIIGPTVNKASWLEPANKDYGTRIIIGERTFKLAKDHIEARLLDKIILKGESEPILIYELICRKGELTRARQEALGIYEKALKVHWYRQFDKAIQLLNNALRIDPTDAPSIALKRRMDRYKRTPPERTWQGELLRADKE